jgi:hypothetical protein
VLSFSALLGVEMMKEVADDVTELRVSGADHWIQEEQPDALAAILELAQHGAAKGDSSS